MRPCKADPGSISELSDCIKTVRKRDGRHPRGFLKMDLGDLKLSCCPARRQDPCMIFEMHAMSHVNSWHGRILAVFHSPLCWMVCIVAGTRMPRKSTRVGQQLNMLGDGRMAFVTMLHRSRLLRVVISPCIRWIFLRWVHTLAWLRETRRPRTTTTSLSLLVGSAGYRSWYCQLQGILKPKRMEIQNHLQATWRQWHWCSFGQHRRWISWMLTYAVLLGYTSCTDTVCPHTPLDWLVSEGVLWNKPRNE